MVIEDIPDFSALQQISRALWKTGKARGAAILVGAGFSRNATLIHENNPKPPLWKEVFEAMEIRLYPNGSPVKEPLRLAEEFKALLGEAALDDLIRELVHDDEWLPSELHRNLVQLPWTDILTTNWDTLLERAALTTLGQTYEVVRSIADIASTRAPRIVKLHGSLPANRPFILSEDDYRTYPARFPPFVNLVQQVLLENELCLLGFSGDDPNFLAWSGWVRDQLGASARRIYLVGALEISPAKRKLLQSRNVSLVDLSPLVAEVPLAARQERATALFLNYLLDSKPTPPWDWPSPGRRLPSISTGHTNNVPLEEVWRQTLKRWEAQRGSYPGWLICPADIRALNKTDTIHTVHQFRNILQSLPESERGNAAFEAVWRLDKFLLEIPSSLFDVLREILREEAVWVNRDHRSFVAAALLGTAREQRDSLAFNELRLYLEGDGTNSQESASEVTYQRCLWARDEMNYAELRELVKQLSGRDPVWKFRKAMLQCQLGDSNATRATLDDALLEVRSSFYRDRNSIWTLSRLAWAELLSRVTIFWESFNEGFSGEESGSLRLRFFETKCDAWDVLSAADRDTEANIKRMEEMRQTKEILFEAGTYRDHSSTLRFVTSWPKESVYEIWRMMEVVGIAPRTDHSLIMCHRMVRAEILTAYEYENEADVMRLLRVLEADPKELISKTFGRIHVAQFTEKKVELLIRVLNRALEYAIEQLSYRKGFSDDFWSTRVAVYVEVLSRLAVRLPPDEASSLFKRALVWAREPQWRWNEFFEPLGHILERSFSAIPPSRKAAFITDALNFPLPDEMKLLPHFEQEWPDSTRWVPESLIRRPDTDTQFTNRVASLIEKVKLAATGTRSRAAMHLAKLYLAGALTVDEEVLFGQALWARRDSDQHFPADTNLLSHMFVLLPAPDEEKARELFLARDHELNHAEYLMAVAGVSAKQKDGSRKLILPADRAMKMLIAILAWRPKTENDRDLGVTRRQNRETLNTIGSVLADAVFPTIALGSIDLLVVEDCLVLVEQGTIPSIAQALPELIRITPSIQDRAIRGILKTMVSIDSDRAWAGFNALHRWVTLTNERVLGPLPRRLVEAVVSIIETRRESGLHHALGVAVKLLTNELFNDEDPGRLIEALALIFIETAYADQKPSELSTTFTFVRAGAVKLADGLRDHGWNGDSIDLWLKAAETDPIPEVRFAVSLPIV